MDCYVCLDFEKSKNIPLLFCGHFCCPECYCKLKINNFKHCLLCYKPLKRRIKKTT